MENSKILIRNAAQIVTCHGDKARRGAEMSDLGVIVDGAVAMSDGVITHVGPTEEVLRNTSMRRIIWRFGRRTKRCYPDL